MKLKIVIKSEADNSYDVNFRYDDGSVGTKTFTSIKEILHEIKKTIMFLNKEEKREIKANRQRLKKAFDL